MPENISSNILVYLFSLGIPTALIVGGVIVFTNYEKCLMISSDIKRLLSWAGNSFKRGHINDLVHGNILKSAKSLNPILGDIFPSNIKIQWISSESKESFLENDCAVICINNDKNQSRVIANAIDEFVKVSLFDNQKHCIPHDIYESSRLTLTRKLLINSNSLQYFMDHNKCFFDDEIIKNNFVKLINLDEGGMFVEVFIRELKKATYRLIGTLPTTEFKNEIADFLNFLHEIAENNSAKPPLAFNQRFIKVGIILVADTKLHEKEGDLPYHKRLQQNFLEGINSNYLYSWESKMEIVKNIGRFLEKDGKTLDKKTNVQVLINKFSGIWEDGRKYTGICLSVDKI